MAIMLYRRDNQYQALAYARRAQALGQRLLERPITTTPIVLADILLALEEYEQAASTLAWITRAAPPGPNDLPSYHTMQLVLAEVGAGGVEAPAVGWDEVIRMADERGLATEEILPLLYWRARMAATHGRREEAVQALEDARRRRSRCTMWLLRFEELERKLSSGDVPGQRASGTLKGEQP
jgi:hypothetical protein